MQMVATPSLGRAMQMVANLPHGEPLTARPPTRDMEGDPARGVKPHGTTKDMLFAARLEPKHDPVPGSQEQAWF